MNNKGFAVSAILYTILICFLMFLGAAIAMFSASNGLVVSSNDDIINGTKLSASRVMATVGESAEEDVICNDGYEVTSESGINFEYAEWSESSPSKMLIRVNSRYGSKFWPRDFSIDITKTYDYDNDGDNDTVYCATSSSNLCVNKVSHNSISSYNNYTFDGDEVVHYSEEIVFVDILSRMTYKVIFKNPCN